MWTHCWMCMVEVQPCHDADTPWLAVVTVCSSRNVYRQVGPAEVQTETSCNLIGCRLCFRPSLFFRRLCLTALALRQIKMCPISKMLPVYFLYFIIKNCICLPLCYLKCVCVCGGGRRARQCCSMPCRWSVEGHTSSSTSHCYHSVRQRHCHCAVSNDSFSNCVAVKWCTPVLHTCCNCNSLIFPKILVTPFTASPIHWIMFRSYSKPSNGMCVFVCLPFP
jgi:hypothetical protein